MGCERLRFCSTQWNKIEHRMFCHITQNWRGKPLESLAVIVDLIGHTTTASALARNDPTLLAKSDPLLAPSPGN